MGSTAITVGHQAEASYDGLVIQGFDNGIKSKSNSKLTVRNAVITGNGGGAGIEISGSPSKPSSFHFSIVPSEIGAAE